ncbi:MAG: outer membrane beta-barrel protein [Treponema sp.]|nr:outer membrane beta-barrel protein [Treponema sp.]
MKKTIILMALVVIVSVSVSAQGFYFDVGAGVGKGWTKIDGIDFAKEIKKEGSIEETGVEFGLKAGFGPFGNIPLYVVADFSGLGHRIADSYNYIQFNSFLIGPGVIFYPIPLLQLGASVGYSWVSNITDIRGLTFYKSDSGFAWNAYFAFDLGGDKTGCLVGVKYSYANNKLETSNVDQNSQHVGVFARFAVRKKIA